jgi:EAL domain-containing protein (putative c-di-GMP-specific phosphodiesterase class I)
VGVETLVRWDHPVRGLVPPDRFLPVAEATGLIVPLDLWVLRTACVQGAQWWRTGLELRVAVNVSARTLTDPRFVPSVVEALSSSGFPAKALEIELTEATAIADTDAVCAVLAALRAQGVTVAVDDLGTGYSSLAWVSSFPVDRIKIDRSFVADLDSGGRGEPLVEALVGIARRLGHGVIAEGVETGSQVRRLLELGCTEAQGFVLGRPGSASDIERQASRPGSVSA